MRKGKDKLKDTLVMLVYRTFPYSSQIQELDTTSEDDAIRFTWRSSRFRVSADFFVETVHGGFLHGDDISILAEALLKKQHFESTTETRP